MEQRVAIVTGGLRGLGRAMALGLAREGHNVVAVGHIDADVVEIETATAGADFVGQIVPLVADLRRPADCDRIVATARERFGGLHILVNNAGLTFTTIDPARFRRGEPQKFWQVSDEIVRAVIETNYIAADQMARRVAPVMVEQGWGRIVNVTTKLDTMNRPHTSPYGASKAALEMAILVGQGLAASVEPGRHHPRHQHPPGVKGAGDQQSQVEQLQVARPDGTIYTGKVIWPLLYMPYVKNEGVFQCPSDGAARSSAASGRLSGAPPCCARSSARPLNEVHSIERCSAAAQLIVQASLLRMWATSWAKMPATSSRVMRRSKPSVNMMAAPSGPPSA